jgi:transcriptional regulator with XRE-family HTH domain
MPVSIVKVNSPEQIPRKVTKLLKKLGLNDRELGERLGVNSTTIQRYRTGSRAKARVDAGVCLMLAALDPEDAQFWLSQSGLNEYQLGLIGSAVGKPVDPEVSEARSLIGVWRDPHGDAEKLAVSIIREAIKQRNHSLGAENSSKFGS